MECYNINKKSTTNLNISIIKNKVINVQPIITENWVYLSRENKNLKHWIKCSRKRGCLLWDMDMQI